MNNTIRQHEIKSITDLRQLDKERIVREIIRIVKESYESISYGDLMDR